MVNAMKMIRGIAASGGIGKGVIKMFNRPGEFVFQEKSFDKEYEIKSFKKAQSLAVEELKSLYEKARKLVGEKDAQIFEAHSMMVESEDLSDMVMDMIEEGYTAPYAVQKAGEQLSDMFASMDDAYMRERASDIHDITARLVRILCFGSGNTGGEIESDTPCILAAEDLFPSDTMAMDMNKVLAFITKKGSRVSHLSILARTLGIPAVVGLNEQFDCIFPESEAIVDGDEGMVILMPDDSTVQVYKRKREEKLVKIKRLQGMKGKESITLDGTRIDICANISSLSDIPKVLENDADGIGLFRTEFLYMESSMLPSEEMQLEVYGKVLESMKNKRVIIRTFDIGADKSLPYLDLGKDENPAMGYRAIRVSIMEQDMMKTQIRALLRASVYGKLAIMFPMIATASELKKAKSIVQACKKELDDEGLPYSGNVEIGIMIEVPSAAIMSDELAKEVDFFSIGTNDLTQFTLAVDRMNPRLADIYDPSNPAVLRLMEMAAQNARKNGIFCGVCGESASDLQLLEKYLRMGITEISVAPSKILEIREFIRSIDLSR